MPHGFYPRVAMGPRNQLLNPLADLLDLICIVMTPAPVSESNGAKTRLDRIFPGRTPLSRLHPPTPRPMPSTGSWDRQRVFSLTKWDKGRLTGLYLEVEKRGHSFRILLAGMWADLQDLEQVRAQATSVPKARITGSIPEVDPMRLESQALLFFRYGFVDAGPGVGGLEALACGSISICNRGLGLSEIILGDQSGFVLSRAGPLEISQLVERMDAVSNVELARISKAASERASENSWLWHCLIPSEAIQSVSGSLRRTAPAQADRYLPPTP